MHDILPQEMQVRQRLLARLRRIYGSFGYLEIETPSVERIQNLSSGQGGENEKLVFKIMKRGEKLASALKAGSAGNGAAAGAAQAGGNAEGLADGGLRYDLTMPLSRFYAAHRDELPQPFKALQIGHVWRADRPAKGRFRQFMQCDIDILGEPSVNAEIELVYATSRFLASAGVGGCVVHVNDRHLLTAFAETCGFRPGKEADGAHGSDEADGSGATGDFGPLMIILDKYDKIGLDGVCAELEKEGEPAAAIARYRELFAAFVAAPDKMAWCRDNLAAHIDTAVLDRLDSLFEALQTLGDGQLDAELDISLVRGMGYYTGTIFEVTSSDFDGASIAGGGRYDHMVGNFCGQQVAACGFSIGFERIVSALLDKPEALATLQEGGKTALLYDKRMTAAEVTALQEQAEAARAQGQTVAVIKAAKNRGYQKKQLAEFGFTEFEEVG
jgi:histidyl-tRNA synthetase